MTMNAEIEIKTQTCAQCGILMLIPQAHDSRLRDSHETFYCLKGHPQSYSQKTDEEIRIEKLERELALKNEKILQVEEQLKICVAKGKRRKHEINKLQEKKRA